MINGTRSTAEILVDSRNVIGAVIARTPFLIFGCTRMCDTFGRTDPIIAAGLSGRRRETRPTLGNHMGAHLRFKAGIHQDIGCLALSGEHNSETEQCDKGSKF